MKTINILPLALLLAILVSCKKDNKTSQVTETVTTGGNNNQTTKPLVIKFKNVVGNEDLVFNAKYKNANGDTFQVTKFNYYISNVSLVKSDNSVFKIPESYFLLEQSNISSLTLNLNGIPAGDYKEIKFMLGVDSTRNTSGAQTGALDPAKGMFWSWNSGYIMLKMEGTSPVSGAANKSIVYHVGGFHGTNKVQKEFNLSFGSSVAQVSSTSSSILNLETNLSEMFENPSLINFVNDYYVMSPGTLAKMYADNYADMITFKSIQ